MNNRKNQEIEMKFKLLNANQVVERMAELGAEKMVTDEYQKDTYFAPQHRDFFAQDIVSEWLRLRETSTVQQLNYKRWLPLGAAIQTHCEEHETDLSNAAAMEKILDYLDFHRVICVEKIRNIWKYKNILICIDAVTELGTFIEMEYAQQVPEEKISEIASFMEQVLHQELNASVEARDRRGYPYQMMVLNGLL